MHNREGPVILLGAMSMSASSPSNSLHPQPDDQASVETDGVGCVDVCSVFDSHSTMEESCTALCPNKPPPTAQQKFSEGFSHSPVEQGSGVSSSCAPFSPPCLRYRED